MFSFSSTKPPTTDVPTLAKPLEIDEIKKKLTEKVKSQIDEKKRDNIKHINKGNIKLDKFIRTRHDICNTYIASIEATIQKMAETGKTKERLKADTLCLGKPTSQSSRYVSDELCVQQVKTHFRTNYEIPMEHTNFEGYVVKFHPDTGFKINIPTNMIFSHEYVVNNNHNVEFSNETALRKTYEKYMPYDYDE